MQNHLNKPPQNIPAERLLIGGLLMGGEVVIDSVVDHVAAVDFYSDDFRKAYEVILSLYSDSKKVDLITVSNKLGGNSLSELGFACEDTRALRNAPEHAKIIRERAIERSLLLASYEIQEIVASDRETKEKSDMSERAIMQVTEVRDTTGPVLVDSVMDDFVDDLERRFELKGEIVGLSTGFDRLDKKTGGLEGGDLVIIAGRPSMGKTSLAMNMAQHVTIDQKKNACVFTMEMPNRQIIQRMVSSSVGVPLQDLKSGRIDEDMWPRVTRGIQLVSEAPLRVDETPGLTPTQIRSRARRIHRKTPLSLIVIDYLQLMEATTHKDNQNLKIAEITRSMKGLAIELDVPVILLSQLNRDVEKRADRRPKMSDLRDSGAIEQDADIILMTYRDEQYDKDSPNAGLAEIVIAKQRNGETGTITLGFEGAYTRFTNTDQIASGYQAPKAEVKQFSYSKRAS